jgi:hypothetical protein
MVEGAAEVLMKEERQPEAIPIAVLLQSSSYGSL